MNTLLQILVTVWVHGHPVSALLPREYPALSDACDSTVSRIFAHRKKTGWERMKIECVHARTRSA